MPSPFPGMDPYLENSVFWAGIHANLYGRIQTALNRSLPSGYYADIDEYVWLQAEDPEDRLRLGKPDTFISDKNGSHRFSNGHGRLAVLTPPVTVTLPGGKKKTRKYVKIVSADNARVVTVIEILSPSNKHAILEREKYLTKREEYVLSSTNLVEIDLLRSGVRLPMGAPEPPDADYYILICRRSEYPEAKVWPFTIREAIPDISIPLNGTDREPVLDLQACLSEIYEAQRYSMRIDYSLPPVPPLRSTDAVWAADLLKKASRKKKK